jgi:hypothetical protein
MVSIVAGDDTNNSPVAKVMVTTSAGGQAEAIAAVLIDTGGNIAGIPDANGIVIQSGASSTFWSYAAGASGIVNTATAVTIKTAGASGVRNMLHSLTIAHDTLGAATELVVRDGAAGPVLFRTKLQTASKEDSNIFFDPPLRGTAATLMEVATLTAVTGGVYVNAQGFTGS